MENKPLLTLCIPTNGVVQWVFPVLESIYSQEVDNALFEVVITDNGDSQEFKKKIREYVKAHVNIVYEETRALPFINEIESYKRASGEMIKFVNHRTLLVEGALKRLIEYAENNRDKKPVTYFTNGVLTISPTIHEYHTFDEFVHDLSFWSSWSTGMAIWKTDFDKLPENVSDFNELFPHTNVLFNERDRDKYVIDNTVIFDELPQGKKSKGNYDLYYAFGVEYPKIIENLYKDQSITKETLASVVDNNLEFIALLFWKYNIKKEYCSYDLSGLKNMYGVYYSKRELYQKVVMRNWSRLIEKLKRGVKL